MKITKGKIILAIIVIYFIVFAAINVNKEKNNNKDILNKVVYVTDAKLSKKNEGKLVLVSGKIGYDKLVSFDELENFGTIKISRTVEDFVKIVDESDKTHYDWNERKVALEGETDFLKTVISEKKISKVFIGDYELDSKGLDLIKADKHYSDQEEIAGLTTTGLSYERDPWEEDLEVGDVRLTYKYYDLKKHPYMSILAVQKGNSFVPYKVDNKTEIYQVFDHKVSNKSQLSKELKINVKNTKRGKSLFILMILGIGIVLIVDSKKAKKEVKQHEK